VARDNNTYAKRQREMQKKRKAEDKRARRQMRKGETNSVNETSVEDRPPNDP
jgi:sRNA-binding protein